MRMSWRALHVVPICRSHPELGEKADFRALLKCGHSKVDSNPRRIASWRRATCKWVRPSARRPTCLSSTRAIAGHRGDAEVDRGPFMWSLIDPDPTVYSRATEATLALGFWLHSAWGHGL